MMSFQHQGLFMLQKTLFSTIVTPKNVTKVRSREFNKRINKVGNTKIMLLPKGARNIHIILKSQVRPSWLKHLWVLRQNNF